jgi:hypothetical protein
MSIIAAGTTTTTALSSTGNTDGTLQFQVNGTTASVTLNALGAVGVGASPNFGNSGQALLSGGSTAAPAWGNVQAPLSSGTNIKTVNGESLLGSGNLAVGDATLAGAQTFTGTKTFAGTSSTMAIVLNDAAETATITATAATGTIAYDVTTQSVLFYTSNASANWTVNFRASSGTTLNTALATGQSVTAAFLVTQGSTAYFNSAVQVDGTTSGVTTRWQGGTAPSAGNANGIDVYVYSIIKTGSATFTVLASQTRFA